MSIEAYPSRRSIRPKTIVASLLAAAMLAGSIAPAAANFRHHFYRGQPYGSLGHPAERDARRDMMINDPMALSEAAWHDQCAARFKSYDPRTGHYLGYDGRYKPCT